MYLSKGYLTNEYMMLGPNNLHLLWVKHLKRCVRYM